MKYIELKILIKLKEDIALNCLAEKLSQAVNKYFTFNEKTKKFHKESGYKGYIFSSLMPLEKDKVYKKERVYSLFLNFLNLEILNDFYKSLLTIENDIFTVVNRSYAPIEINYKIKEIQSVTPVIITKPYTRPIRQVTADDYDAKYVKEQLINNTCKKYNSLFNESIKSYDFIEQIEILNRKSIVSRYKNGVLIGNKYKLTIKDDELSQKLAFIIMGCGLGEKNTLSFGYCINRPIKEI